MPNKTLSKMGLRLVFIIISLFLTVELYASTVITGTIVARQQCQAYVSKNKRTNPGKVKLELNKSYQIFEANRSSNANWYRIRVTTVSPSARWVSKTCGDVTIGTVDPVIPGGDDLCRTAGHEDSYKLALSWQPAFCETHQAKPECQLDNPKLYQASNFVLHGLWPNKKACGTHYGYCGEVRNKPGDFCDYPVLNLFTHVRTELQQIMPSASAGSCLQRHEWHKHGTCQVKWSIDEYFEHAIDLTRQFNESGVGYFMSRNIGKQVSEEDFYKRVDCALGANAHKRLNLKCKNGKLVDVYISLPLDSSINQDLSVLMSRATEDFSSNCGGNFRIDPIGLGN